MQIRHVDLPANALISVSLPTRHPFVTTGWYHRPASLRAAAETDMLINCVVYQDGKKLADIAPEDISDWRSRTAASYSIDHTPRSRYFDTG